MSITVHDGSTDAAYDSYADLASADTYHATRATPSWDGASTAAREAALVRATDYVDASYTFIDGPLLDDAVHPLVIKATIVMAAHAIADTLAGRDDRDVIETEQELSGVGKKRIKYDTSKVIDPYPLVTKILAPITGKTSQSVTTGRLDK